MKKNRGIQKLAILALLCVFTFSNTIPYQQFIQKNRQMVRFITSPHLVC